MTIREPRPWSLPEEGLARMARESLERAKHRGPSGNLELLHSMLNSVDVEKHGRAVRLVRRALRVDMGNPLNRKGALPQALGLVSRRDPKSLAIVFMAQKLGSTRVDDPRARCRPGECADAQRPCPSPELECARTCVYPENNQVIAQAVVDGFYLSGVDETLTVQAVEKVLERYYAIKKPTTR